MIITGINRDSYLQGRVVKSNIFAFLFLTAVFLPVFGCSSKKTLAIEKSNYRVSVTSAGKPVKDFADTFLHRIFLSKLQISELRTMLNSNPIPSLEAIDQFGQHYGTELLAPVSLLGLDVQDVLTAVERLRVPNVMDLSLALNEADAGKEGTFTFLRKGKSHKTLVSLTAEP